MAHHQFSHGGTEVFGQVATVQVTELAFSKRHKKPASYYLMALRSIVLKAKKMDELKLQKKKGFFYRKK